MVIELAAGTARCTVAPADGGRVAVLTYGEADIVVPRRAGQGPMEGGCFPMAPWAGRIREGRFEFEGNEYHLERAMPPHAIHGTVYNRSWDVDDLGEAFVALSCPTGPGWPFGGLVRHRIELVDEALRCTLSLTADELAMPAQVGWHPWFPRPRAARLEFAAMYERDEYGIPNGRLVQPPVGPVDDCFVDPLGPLEMEHDDVIVSIESDCDHWVVYSEQRDEICVEPQSGPPDGVTIAPCRLAPGETLSRTMTIRWRSTTAS
jgi:aldose 1-epimerase